MVSIKTNFNGLDINIGEKFSKNMQRHLKLAGKQISTLITKTARNDHRYNHRTGKLRSATMSKTIESKTKLIIDSYINDGIAPYGKYIHNGTGTWAADPFIDDSIKKNWNKINEIIKKHIDEAIDETFKRGK